MIRSSSLLSLLLLLAFAAPARADLPKGFDWGDSAVKNLVRESSDLHEIAGASSEETARIARILIRGGDAESALRVLMQTPDLARFEALRKNDEQQDTSVRRLYDDLDDVGKQKLLGLVQSAGAAGTAAGEMQLGTISDCDDTAFPTEHMEGFHPLGYKDANKLYALLGSGTDGKGDARANVHYVSARPPILGPDAHLRAAAAGLPFSTIDGDSKIKNLLNGLDGIEASKEENIDLWLRLHPGQRFVFLGDTLQRDPEVYRTVLAQHAGQVELVLIHKAGDHGQVRDPEDYAGEIFFGNYDDAIAAVKALDVPQPGAKQTATAPDLSQLALPDTDTHDIHVNPIQTAGQFVLENGAAVGKVAGVEIAKGATAAGKGIAKGVWHGIKGLGHLIGIGGGSKDAAARPQQPRTGATQALSGALGNNP